MILVTGGTGLVGAHLLLELARSGNKVRAVHRKDSDLQVVKKIFSYYMSSEEAETCYEKIEWQEADILDVYALTRAFEDVSVVYHCAALVSFDSSRVRELRKTNIEGTANIVNVSLACGVRKLCHLSSIATMDAAPGTTIITEDFSWFPEKNHSEYAISKHGAEIEVWRGSQEGLAVIILNPGIIIGPGFWDSGSGEIFRKVYGGLDYYFPKVTGFVGVKDVVQAAIRLTESTIANQQYTAVAENLSFREVLNQVAESLDKPLPKKRLKPWMVVVGWIYQSAMKIFTGSRKNLRLEDRRTLYQKTFYSNEKLKSELDFEFTPISKVISETAEIFKEEQK